MQIFHNPHCSKSREALKIIKEQGIEPEIIDYLKTPPTEAKLRELLFLLGMKPEEIIRKKEKVFLENYKDKNFSDDEWIEILCENPVLIERPIVVENGKAVIGRSAEKVLELMKK
jgi:arsenate reductase (glutaredoxin)